METKICTKCSENGEQPIENFGWQKDKKYKWRRSICKKCCSKAELIRYASKKEEIIKRVCAYQIKNRAQISNYLKLYREKNSENILSSQIKRDKRIKDNLEDLFIKKMIYNTYGISFKDIPASLIELYRTNLILKRKINNYVKSNSIQRKDT